MTDGALSLQRMTQPPAFASSLAPPATFRERFDTPLRVTGAVVQGLHDKNAPASALSPLSESIAMGGGLILATFATLTDPKKTLGAGHLLAVSSWALAFLGGQRLLDALASLKTGLNMRQEFVTSDGQRRPLFGNPQAIPYQLIPEERFHWTGDRLGVPYTQQRPRLIEEKIQQTSIQNRTWGLLIAGLGMPVATMAMRDLFQNAAYALGGRIKAHYHLARVLQFREAPVLAERALDNYLDHQLGQNKFSWFSRWQKSFEEKLTSRLNLQPHLSVGRAVRLNDHDLGEALFQRLRQYRQHPAERLTLLTMRDFLQEEAARVDAMNANVVNLRALKELPETLYEKARARLRERQREARSLVERYEKLFLALMEGHLDDAALKRQFETIGSRPWLEKAARGELRPDDIAELPKSAVRIMTTQASEVGKSFEEKLAALSERLRPLPREHLTRTTRALCDKRLWNRRVFGYLGSALIASTALYYSFFLGQTQPRTGGRS